MTCVIQFVGLHADGMFYKQGEYMPQCSLMKSCPIFNLAVSAVSPNDMESYRRKYCHADRFACARYLVASSVGRERVPFDLEPGESARALKIMRNSN